MRSALGHRLFCATVAQKPLGEKAAQLLWQWPHNIQEGKGQSLNMVPDKTFLNIPSLIKLLSIHSFYGWNVYTAQLVTRDNMGGVHRVRNKERNIKAMTYWKTKQTIDETQVPVKQ